MSGMKMRVEHLETTSTEVETLSTVGAKVVSDGESFMDMLKDYMTGGSDEEYSSVTVRVGMGYDDENKPAVITVMMDDQMYLLDPVSAMTGAAILPVIAKSSKDAGVEGAEEAITALADALSNIVQSFMEETTKDLH